MVRKVGVEPTLLGILSSLSLPIAPFTGGRLGNRTLPVRFGVQLAKPWDMADLKYFHTCAFSWNRTSKTYVESF